MGHASTVAAIRPPAGEELASSVTQHLDAGDGLASHNASCNDTGVGGRAYATCVLYDTITTYSADSGGVPRTGEWTTWIEYAARVPVGSNGIQA